MTPWRRFARFNAVGALGIVVQLSTIWALTDGARVPYLPATLVGVGTAILHNFLWHLRWTWGDRPRTATGAFDALLRFAAANGLVSIGGNAAIMAALVGGAGWHPIPANAIAIAACGLLNFWLGDRLVFRPALTPAARP